MKSINLILRKCKSLSKLPLGRSRSYNSLRSKSARKEEFWDHFKEDGHDECQKNAIIYVGSTRKRYSINSRYLNHPIVNALIERSRQKKGEEEEEDGVVVIKCEVVLFDHLLWMLENSDPNLSLGSLEELTNLYLF